MRKSIPLFKVYRKDILTGDVDVFDILDQRSVERHTGHSMAFLDHWEGGTIVAVGASSSVLIDGGAALSASGAKVEVQDSVKNLSLACSGELVLGEGAVHQ